MASAKGTACDVRQGVMMNPTLVRAGELLRRKRPAIEEMLGRDDQSGLLGHVRSVMVLGLVALVLAGLLTLSITVPAAAQKCTEAETGSNIPIPRRARIADTPGLSEADRGRLAMAEFARCTVDRHAAGVAKLLRLTADKIDRPAVVPLADNECLASGEIRFQPILLRGALFVELYRRRQAAEARGQTWQLPSTPFDPKGPGNPIDPASWIQIGLLAFAHCVVSHNPVAAKAVVVARTASKPQDAAFVALLPSLGPCLLQGQKIRLGKIVLEGALGEILYRGTVPSVSPASKETN